MVIHMRAVLWVVSPNFAESSWITPTNNEVVRTPYGHPHGKRSIIDMDK